MSSAARLLDDVERIANDAAPNQLQDGQIDMRYFSFSAALDQEVNFSDVLTAKGAAVGVRVDLDLGCIRFWARLQN